MIVKVTLKDEEAEMFQYILEKNGITRTNPVDSFFPDEESRLGFYTTMVIKTFISENIKALYKKEIK